MESALRYELIKAIPELNNSIYPTNAPEGSQGPYLVYARISTKTLKTLQGLTDKESISYMFSIMTTKYSDMVKIRKQVVDTIKGMAQREIGNTNKFFIEDIDINNIDEQYEHELKLNRGIIDFTIYY